MAAPAAPAAGAGVEALAGLLLIVGFVVLLGMQQAWRATIGWLFHKLADLIDIDIGLPHLPSIHPFGFAAHALRAASDNVYAALGAAALALERSALWLFHQAARQIKWTGREIAGLASDTWHTLHGLVTVEIPHAARVATQPLRTRLHGIDQTLGRLDKLAHEQLRRLRAGIDRIDRSVTRTIPHAIDAVGARVGRVGSRVNTQARRISRVEKLLAASAFAALTATALKRLGLNWLRCSNVKRAGRQLCGIDPQLLEGMLGEALLIASAISLVEFAEALQKPTELVADGLERLIREL